LLVALKKVLRKPEYHIVSCADRGSAILFLKTDPRYALLLFDLELHGSTGLKLARLTQSLPQPPANAEDYRYLERNNQQPGKTRKQGWRKRMPDEDRRHGRTISNDHAPARKRTTELTD